MANYSASRSVHKSLAADTEDVVTLTTVEFNRVEVLNRHASAWLFFTVDDTAAVVDGNNTFIVPPNSGFDVADLSIATATKVRLISSTDAVPYSVTGFSEAE